MTKQEEIRAEINQQIELAILGVVVNVGSNPLQDYGGLIRVARKEIIKYLRSQGVVIKGQCLGVSHPHLAAYYTVEPLIEEE